MQDVIAIAVSLAVAAGLARMLWRGFSRPPASRPTAAPPAATDLCRWIA